MEKLVEVGILFDFYGKLLSEKQYLAIELYYLHDLSLAEIGDEIDVTRQGIFDMLKRAEQKLYRFEDKLRLVDKFHKSHNNIESILSITEDIIDITKQTKELYIEEKLLEIKDICEVILDNK